MGARVRDRRTNVKGEVCEEERVAVDIKGIEPLDRLLHHMHSGVDAHELIDNGPACSGNDEAIDEKVD